jgi:hypothetical protein
MISVSEGLVKAIFGGGDFVGVRLGLDLLKNGGFSKF